MRSLILREKFGSNNEELDPMQRNLAPMTRSLILCEELEYDEEKFNPSNRSTIQNFRHATNRKRQSEEPHGGGGPMFLYTQAEP